MTLATLFLHGGALPILLLAPLVWLALYLHARRRERRLNQVIGPRTHALAGERSTRRRAIRRAALGVGLLLGLIAGLGPVFGDQGGERTWQGADMVVCLDVSRSMLASDMPPDRLTRAKDEIRALADRAEGDRFGLVVFAGEARRTVPLTRDRTTFVELAAKADPYSVSRGGSDLGAALDVALVMLDVPSVAHGAVLLLTDGEDHEGRALEIARRLGARGITVHTVGFGTARGGKIALGEEGGGGAFLRDRAGRDVVSSMDAGSLRRVAAATGGTFVDAGTSPRPLLDLYERHVLPAAGASVGAASGEASDEGGGAEDRFQWFLLAAFAFLLLHWMMTDRSRA